MNWKSTGKKVWTWIWQSTLVLFLMLCFLEMVYRFQWFDFFKPEFKALNKEIDPKKPNILVFGDSFTAHPKSYVNHLRRAHRDYNFINCAMAGSGPYEMELMAARRIADYPPKAVIYQMYVGNDLTDIDPPTNWSTLSLSRNIYWTSRQWFQVLGFFSRRASGLQSDFDAMDRKQDEEPFAIKQYAPRTKMMVKADANYLQKCVQVDPSYQSAMESAKENLRYLRACVPSNVPIYVVIVPHFSQVTKQYNARYKKLSGYATDMRRNYGFYKEICKVKGISVLNPIGFFREKEKEGIQLYFNNDPHLTTDGQDALFTYLDGQLKRLWKQ